eukprot:7386305-Prymnesium_polylepis.1
MAGSKMPTLLAMWGASTTRPLLALLLNTLVVATVANESVEVGLSSPTLDECHGANTMRPSK